MSDIRYNIGFDVNGNNVLSVVNRIDTGVNRINQSVGRVNGSFARTIDSINNKLKTIKLDSFLNNIERVSAGLSNLKTPGANLTTSMYDLQAITGVAGDKLKQIEGYARQSAKTFGGDAADGVEAYKLILSQLTPEIGKTPAALDSMGNSVMTLSKLMGGDALASTEVLTTAMNQYQVDMDDPIQASKIMADMMNVMAAAAKEGSAELPQIKEALSQSGMAAKMANVSFAETNSAIQLLDKAGKKGAEGGVALRNVLATLAQGRFLPKDVQKELTAAGVNVNKLTDNSLSLADRLKPLKSIMNDQALVTKLFGKENSNAALAMLSGIEEMERMTPAINDTKTAYEQAAIIMEDPAEKAARMKAAIDDFKISLYEGTNGWLGYASVAGEAASNISGLIPLFGGAAKAIGFLTSAEKMNALYTGIVAGLTKGWTAVQWLLNAAFWANPITWVVVGIIALIAVIGYVIAKTEGWGAAWSNTVNGAKSLWSAFTNQAKFEFLTVVDYIMSGIDIIKKGWYNLKSLWDEEGASVGLAQIQAASDARQAQAQGYSQAAKKDVASAKNSFTTAFDSIKWKGGNVADIKKGMGDKLGISAPKLPGTANAPTGGAHSATGSGSGAKSNSAIATGGTKTTTVHINIGKQIETLNITPGNIQEGATRMREIIVDELTRAVAMANSVGE